MVSYKVTLTVISGPQKGLVIEAERDTIYIGRDKNVDLWLNDAAVSSKHARITITYLGVEIEDLNSRNGTFINNVPIQSGGLRHLDKVLVGQTEIQVKIEEPEEKASITPPPPPSPDVKGPPRPQIREQTKDASIKVPVISRIFVAGFPDNMRKVIVNQLKEHNIVQEVVQAQNGGEALELLTRALKDETLPELIIVSLKMPILNGINVSISLRAYEQGFGRKWKVPIIFICPPMDSEGGFKKAVAFLAPARHVPVSEEPGQFVRKLEEFLKELRERAQMGVPLA